MLALAFERRPLDLVFQEKSYSDCKRFLHLALSLVVKQFSINGTHIIVGTFFFKPGIFF